MSLEYPFALLIIPVFILCTYLCKIREQSLIFPHMGLFNSTVMKVSSLLVFLKWVGVVTLIIALASPYSEDEVKLDPREGYDIVLLLDASNSMRVRGFDQLNRNANRFDVVKGIVQDFIKTREEDNLGMIVFGSYAFVASPITYDKHILSKLLDQLHIGVAGPSTAIFDGIAQAVTLMQENEAKSKIAILLTDGRNEAGVVPYDAAISLAKKEGMKIYTIGIGRPGEFEQPTLAKIAEDTGAKHFSAYSAGELKKIYKTINELEKTELTGESYLHKSYFYTYFLFVALMSLILYVFLRSKRALL